MDNISQYLDKARDILRYYRTGPLGDVPSINGKVVEEALRKVMSDGMLVKVTTSGLVDLGIASKEVGFQVKTYRQKIKKIIFCRSDKASKELRIADVRERVAKSLVKVGARKFYLLDIDTFTSDFQVYHLADLKLDGEVRTFGSFLKPDHVHLSLNQTHFKIDKVGLLKVA